MYLDDFDEMCSINSVVIAIEELDSIGIAIQEVEKAKFDKGGRVFDDIDQTGYVLTNCGATLPQGFIQPILLLSHLHNLLQLHPVLPPWLVFRHHSDQLTRIDHLLKLTFLLFGE